MRRKAVEKCDQIKAAMIAGIWGNSNYDSQEQGKEGARRVLLEGVEEQFRDAIAEIYRPPKEKSAKKQADEDFWKNPFFAASKAPRIRYDEDSADLVREMEEKPALPTPQEQEKAKLLAALDQTAGSSD